MLVNKETPISKSAGVLDLSGAVKEFAPKPERWKGPLGGCDAFVDRVMLTSNSEDFFIIKVWQFGNFNWLLWLILVSV